MSGSARMSGEAFAIARLQENPNLDYASLRTMATQAGISIAPIQYGRARRHLGLPPMKDRPEPVNVRQPAPAAERTRPAAPAPAEDGDAEADDDAPAAPAQPAATNADALVAPRRKGSAAFDFLVQELRKDSALSYGDLKNRAEAKGFKIAPIMYGRAKAVLGLVPVRPRGSAKAAAAAPKPTGPLTLKQVESVAADRFSKHLAQVQSTEQLIAAVKDIDAERRRLRQLLEKIVALIDEALG